MYVVILVCLLGYELKYVCGYIDVSTGGMS